MCVCVCQSPTYLISFLQFPYYPPLFRFMTYRAFNLAPFSEQECRTVMNRPTFPDQINIQPLSQQQRLHQMQMQQQQRQEMLAKNQAALAPNPSSASGGAAAGGSGGGSATTSGSQKKRASRPSTGGADSKGATPSNNKKKVQEPLDPRQAAVKAMIAQAAKNAQSTQAQLSGQSPRMSIGTCVFCIVTINCFMGIFF